MNNRKRLLSIEIRQTLVGDLCKLKLQNSAKILLQLVARGMVC